jgi:hypothetical protein
MFENRAVLGMFESKGMEVAGGWGKLENVSFCQTLLRKSNPVGRYDLNV